MAQEMWRDVLGYEGLYQVSDRGRVKSVARTVSHPHSGTLTVPERIRKPETTKKGYSRVQLSKDGHQRKRFVHDLMLEVFRGACPYGLQARHLDGNNSHNIIENLTWGTRDQNTKDRIRHGGYPVGEDHFSAKLASRDVAFIKRHRGKITMIEMADQFGVHESTVNDICAGRTWRHIR